MRHLLFYLIIISLFTSCHKDIQIDSNWESVQGFEEVSSFDADVISECTQVTKELKNDKHRQQLKKYFDKVIKKGFEVNHLGKIEWDNIITIDRYRQVLSILPIVDKGKNSSKVVSQIFVLNTNLIGHRYLLIDKLKDVNKFKDRELFNYLFEAAEYAVSCSNKLALETRGSCGILNWLFGDGVSCFNFEGTFWNKVGNFFADIFEDVADLFASNGGSPSSGSDWSNFFYFNYGYDNTNALSYTNSNGGSQTSSSDPTESYEPSQLAALQNCVANSLGLEQKTEQILNDFIFTPNIQNIVADNLLMLCGNGGTITATQLENAVASSIISAYQGLPLWDEVLPDVVAEFMFLKKNFVSSKGRQPTYYEKSKLFAEAYWKVVNERAHLALDICGLVPVAGEPCDVINGIIYTIEGEYVSAGFSYAAVFPVYGIAFTISKRVIFSVKNSFGQTVNLVVKYTGTLVEFGNRADLRKALNLGQSAQQAHHLISWAHWSHDLIQYVAKNAKKNIEFFHMNHPRNGLAIDAWRQAARPGEQAGHAAYNNRVLIGLNNIRQKFGLSNPQLLKNELVKFEDFLKNKINSNPNLHLNDIIFTYIP